ncbi:MAG: type II toxin-antitoxin system VapC family toxin [Planctomycetota bacterium]|jgi:predicted nucleic acid-binding protein
MKVVDASAVAALLFGEPRAEEVAERLGDHPLAAPSLIGYEVANACLGKLRRHSERREDLIEGLGLFDQMGIQEARVMKDEVLPLAEQTGLGFYDASYLWLARALDAELVTLDEKLEMASRS